MTKRTTLGAIETVESDYRCWHDDGPRTAYDHAIAVFDYGTTAMESHEHEPLSQRLTREVPDEAVEPPLESVADVWWYADTDGELAGQLVDEEGGAYADHNDWLPEEHARPDTQVEEDSDEDDGLGPEELAVHLLAE